MQYHAHHRNMMLAKHMLCNSGNQRLGRYLMNADRMSGYSPGEGICLSNYCDNIINYIIVAVPVPNVQALYFGLVFFTYIARRKTGTSLIPRASLFNRLSPLHNSSFNIRELDCVCVYLFGRFCDLKFRFVVRNLACGCCKAARDCD